MDLLEGSKIANAPTYSGTRISANVMRFPVRWLLQSVASIGGSKVVVSDAVEDDNVTLTVENVPWDQVLDTILMVKGLDKRVQDNMIFIRPRAELAGRDIAREHVPEMLRE